MIKLKRSDVSITNYQGKVLIVPKTFSGFNVYSYLNAGLKVNPKATHILWNDVVRAFDFDGEEICIKW